MAIKKLHAGIKVGDFIRGPWGYRMNPTAAQVWFKVEDIDGDTLKLINRMGYRKDGYYAQGRKWMVWEPGDPREDGDNL